MEARPPIQMVSRAQPQRVEEQLCSRLVDELAKVEQQLLFNGDRADLVYMGQGKPLRQIQGHLDHLHSVSSSVPSISSSVEIPLGYSSSDIFDGEGDMVILEEDEEAAEATQGRGIWEHWQRRRTGSAVSDAASNTSSQAGSGHCSSRRLVHTASGTSYSSICGTDSQRGSQRDARFGSALLINPGVERRTSCSSSIGAGSSARASTSSFINILPAVGLDSSGSTYLESEASGSCTNCSSPRSSRVIGPSAHRHMVTPPSVRDELSEIDVNEWDDRRTEDSQGEASVEAARRRESKRLSRLARWVGHRVQMGTTESERYAKVLEENGFARREHLRELTVSIAEELGLPPRFAIVLRREALLGLPAERKFGPLPPAPEEPEEEETPKREPDPVEVCIMYRGKRETIMPSTHLSNGFPSQLRDYLPAQYTPRGASRRSLSSDRGGASRESLAHRAHLQRQESGRMAHKLELGPGTNKGRETQTDAWLASSFNHRSGSVAMPKARARSVAGFERPRGCREMTAEIALTVPDKEKTSPGKELTPQRFDTSSQPPEESFAESEAIAPIFQGAATPEAPPRGWLEAGVPTPDVRLAASEAFSSARIRAEVRPLQYGEVINEDASERLRRQVWSSTSPSHGSLAAPVASQALGVSSVFANFRMVHEANGNLRPASAQHAVVRPSSAGVRQSSAVVQEAHQLAGQAVHVATVPPLISTSSNRIPVRSLAAPAPALLPQQVVMHETVAWAQPRTVTGQSQIIGQPQPLSHTLRRA